ncbi:MAG: hypothetical protein IKK82_04780 [Kiritimatiellae bacterium]|nr:hypothetical protein [Kiritimatiellia bacterium]
MKRFAVMLAASALFPAALFGATRSDYLDIVESAVENLGTHPLRRSDKLKRVGDVCIME